MGIKCKSYRSVIFILLISMSMTLVPAFSTSAAAVTDRTREVFNTGWKYYSGTPSGTPQATSYNDSSWTGVNLPHCFNQPYNIATSVNFGGQGWYRKTFNVDSAVSSSRMFIEFEGVFLHCWVYVNGTLVGEHKGGYTGFSYDITPQIVFGGSNVIAVRVSSDWDPQIAPRDGDNNFIGGIYRDVYLVTTNPLHVTWYGTFVTTPFGGALTSSAGYTLPTSYSSAPVKIQTEVKNDSSASISCMVKSSVLNAGNTVVATVQSTQSIAAGATYNFSQSTTVSSPTFWSPSNPYMYKVNTEVYNGSTLVDTYTTPFGIRWFQSTANAGFYLNGSHLFLRGTNIHQDHAGWGTAVTNAALARDIKQMKDMGANFIRGSHYPKDPSQIEACDKLGLVLMLEAPYWGRGGYSGNAASPASSSGDYAPFVSNLQQQITDMVRIARNNPSVMFWSLGNEPTDGALTTDSLNTLVHSLDPSRPTMRVTNFSSGTADVYGKNGSAPAQSTTPQMFTEIWDPVEASGRPGAYSANSDNENAYLLGSAHWCGFDYGTIKGATVGMSGAVDNNRIEKRRWYYLRNRWLGTAAPTWPASGTASKLSLSADKTTIGSDGTDDCQIRVKVLNSSNVQISNNLGVTLTVTSGPGVFPTGKSITLTTPDGINGIEFRAYSGGTSVITASASGVTSGTITITSTGTVIPTTPPVDTASYYTIVNRNSGKSLQPASASTADGANIVQMTNSTAASQQWQFIDAGGGYYKIKNRNSGKIMDINGASTADGAANIQWTDNGGNNQQWQLVDAGGGYYKIKNRNSGKILDIKDRSTADGAQDIQWTDNGGTNQMWSFVKQ